MTAPPTMEPLATVICDETRREDNGKGLLIGVYTGDIIVPKTPANIALAAWLSVRTTSDGIVKFEVRFVGTKGNPVAGFQTEAEITAAGVAGLFIPKLPVLLEGPGTLKFEWKVGDQGWQTLAELEIKVIASTA